jgi:glycosyltransferase involved in cell wall biosynthesis
LPLTRVKACGPRWPRITIVTPSYNQGRFLEETVRSVLAQGYSNLEYFICDGGSSDESLDILRRYGPFLAGWVSEPDGGQAAAINRGLRSGTGEIMGWLNADDILLPGALRRIAGAFLRDPSRLVVTGLRRVHDVDSRWRFNQFDALPTDENVRHYCSIYQETTYWRRRVWDSVGPLDESKQFAMDYDYWQRLIAAGFHFTQLPHYLGAFRTHAEAKSSRWLDVQRRDLQEIYLANGIAVDELEARERLGLEFFLRRDLLYLLGKAGAPARLLVWAATRLSSRGLWPFLRFCHASAYGYRFERAQEIHATRAAAAHAAVSSAWRERKLPLGPPASTQRLARIQRLDRPRVAELIAPTVPDGLFLARGWHLLEVDPDGEPFRWASEQAEIAVTRPTHAHRRLLLEIEPGPGVNDAAFELQLRRQNGELIRRAWVSGRSVMECELLLGETPLHWFRLHAENGGRVFARDPRVMNFRLFGMAWSDDLSWDALSRAGEADAPSAAAGTGLQRLAEEDLCRSGPPDQIFLGRGWHRLEFDDRPTFWRWAGPWARLVILRPSSRRRVLRLELEPGPGVARQPFDLWLRDHAGQLIAQSRAAATRCTLDMNLPLQPAAAACFSFEVPGGGSRIPTDPRILNFCLYRIGWADA